MAIEPAVRYHPAPWIVLGPMLLASFLSVGLALLAVLGGPPWGQTPGTAGRPAGPSVAGQGAAGPPPYLSGSAAPAVSPAVAAPPNAVPAGTAYLPAPAAGRHRDDYQRSLLLSGTLGLAIAIIGVTMISRRRQLW